MISLFRGDVIVVGRDVWVDSATRMEVFFKLPLHRGSAGNEL